MKKTNSTRHITYEEAMKNHVKGWQMETFTNPYNGEVMAEITDIIKNEKGEIDFKKETIVLTDAITIYKNKMYLLNDPRI